MKPQNLRRTFGRSLYGWLRIVLISLAVPVLNPGLSLQASPVGEMVERALRFAGKGVDDAARVAAKEAVERAVAKHGEEVAKMVEEGGFALAESAAKHGDEVWRLAKLAPGAPNALAARPAELLAIGSRWGDEAVKLEIKVPASAEFLAQRLPRARLAELADRGTPREIEQLAVLAQHGTQRDLEAGVAIWNRYGGRLLEFWTPKRILALGTAAALVTVSWKAPEAVVALAELALKGLLGPVLFVASWALLLTCLVWARRPLIWLTRQTVLSARFLWCNVRRQGESLGGCVSNDPEPAK